MTDGNDGRGARLHILDVLRGVAALSVVAWHWRHFYFEPTTRLFAIYAKDQPFYGLLYPFYAAGWLAVDLFFVLSGFVFFWLYAKAVSGRKIGARKFALLRFSRLYPLHLATFATVCGLQAFYAARHGGVFFVYQQNDLSHAAASLIGFSGWGIVAGEAFNGPFWSVSVEILLYCVFFLLCRCLGSFSRGRSLLPAAAAVLAMGGALLIVKNEHVGRGLLCFFSGGLGALAYGWIAKRPDPRPWALLIAALAAAGWLAGIFGGFTLLNVVMIMAAAFTLTVMALALAETLRPGLARSVAFAGNLSYSSYLIHFPLQIVFALAAESAHAGPGFFYRKSAMLLFFAALIPLSFSSYYFFERPAQCFLRKKLTGRRTVLHADPS